VGYEIFLTVKHQRCKGHPHLAIIVGTYLQTGRVMASRAGHSSVILIVP
jgi:hypothetical protein